ncbi:MAG: hypothetical protein ACRDRL_19700, partial [Sciscionella sp.]
LPGAPIAVLDTCLGPRELKGRVAISALVALPYINAAQAAHPPQAGHLAVFKDAGVQVLLGPGGHTPYSPGRGDASAFPWQQALDRASAVRSMLRRAHRAADTTEPQERA